MSILDSFYALLSLQDDLGNTPLHYATINGNLELVTYLIEGEPEEDEEGNTVIQPRPAVDKNIQNEDGFTALVWTLSLCVSL